MAGKDAPSETDIFAVLKQFIVKTKNIRFEGDGYSAEWHAEAQRVSGTIMLSSIETEPHHFAASFVSIPGLTILLFLLY
jgi:glutamine synthetase type III